MSKGLLFRLLICIFTLGLFLYAYVDKQNGLTELKMQIPKLSKDLKELQEEKVSLTYAIDQFENPKNLLNKIRLSEFSHLKYPFSTEVIILLESREEKWNPSNHLKTLSGS